jgi:hypothetical protein
MRGVAAALILAAAILAAATLAAASLGGASAALAQAAPTATAASAASADSSTAPATNASAPVAQPGGDTTADQIAAWLKAGEPAPDPNAPQDGGGAPRQIHGEVGLTVSNRGYGGYAAASVPVGQASDVDVAVGGSHERLPWGGSANTRSLAIGIHLDGGDVDHWLRGDKCIQHAVRLRDDPVLLADGTCAKPSADDAPPPDHGS